ncbi:Major Facilitator Superfamily protein [Thermomonospora echinospora]|uniref:Major Facilitator Superfamily protein n=1 Tax=Thermomonospora echinospora TaxID=1992 RepID=A0A1H5SC97_9ACTN|nr:MFS transporter [Thermomonospora echinospora]SEF48202.1 Major Facilitator Superfamily protein [Thermomonospora echinospora]
MGAGGRGSGGRGDRLVVPLLAFLGVMAYALSMAVVTPALPLIQEGLDTTPGGAAWALTAMTLSAAVGTPVIGRLGDLYGPRRVLLVVLAVALAGMVVAALATSLPVMLAGRALAGVGGGVFPLAYTIIRDVYPPHRTASAVGLMSSMLGLGGALSWVIAGPVIDWFGWRWLLWVPVAGLLPGTLLAWWIVPKSAGRPAARIDWWGAVLFAAWLVGGLTALTQAPQWGWADPAVLGLLAAAAVLAAAWLVVESRVAEPLVDLRVMRGRGVWTANVASMLSGYALMAGGILFPLLVQLPADTGFGFGGSATEAALLQLPASVGMTVAGFTAGMLDVRIGSRTVLLAGSVLTLLGYGYVAFAHSQMWQLYVGGVARGIGLGLAYAAVANLVVAAVPPGQTGVATGVNTLIRTVGASLGTQASAAIVAASAPVAGGTPSEGGFTAGFTVAAAVMAAAIVLALIAPSRRPGPAGRPPDLL